MLTRLRVVLREDAVEQLLLVKVALEATKALEVAVEEHWQVLVVLEGVFRYLEPHARSEALEYILQVNWLVSYLSELLLRELLSVYLDS